MICVDVAHEAADRAAGHVGHTAGCVGDPLDLVG